MDHSSFDKLRKQQEFNTNAQTLNNCRGFGLIESAVALVVLSFIIIGFTRYLSDSHRSMRSLSILSTRDQLFSRLLDTLRNPDAVRVSLNSNSALYACVHSNCNTGSGSFRLRLPYSTTPVAGSTNSPAYYTDTGQLCSTAAPKCKIRAITSWQASCANGAAPPCGGPASSLLFHLTVEETSIISPLDINMKSRTTLGSPSATPPIAPFPVVLGRNSLINIPEAIICRKTNFFSPNNNIAQPFNLWFQAAECGGTLPDVNYFGTFAAMEICGADESWIVLQPTATTGPGVSVWFLGACPAPSSASEIQVMFTRRF